ncbi:endonuclease V [Tenacibaculum sp. M341]|uniref:endonuclease V n=1 Tax=Tenacibaculum sp. M341 TaxID=2530339 RepID=UPI001043205B|nr:endonuclease V [Tenacibaculum sp. M341]TCI90024.1 endonuclease V [Tenacibaculum sp. M341]
MILAFDTYYFEDKARTIALQFENWNDEQESLIFDETLSGISEYVSGEFYKRELPCILSLLKQIDLTNCEAIIIDGFVVLDDIGKLGLGGYLHEALEENIPIIGVAKNNFSQIETLKKAVLRGESKKPLYITAKGVDLTVAADKIKNMNGEYRIPNILKRVDAIGRDNI